MAPENFGISFCGEDGSMGYRLMRVSEKCRLLFVVMFVVAFLTGRLEVRDGWSRCSLS